MRARGFTLLEVMVALAIAVPALLVLYQESGTALQVTSASLAQQNAISRAQSHLAALAATGVTPGDREGDDGGGYRWRVRAVPVASRPGRGGSGPQRSPYAAGTTLYAVSVQVTWQSSHGAQQFTLETRLLGAAMGEAP